MSRLHVAGVVLASFALLSGGPPAAAPAAETARTQHRAARVSEHIRNLNSGLSQAGAERIWSAVNRYAEKYELAPDLVLAVLEVESHARIGARSPKGALGLMQVMPHMAAMLDLAGNYTTVETNIEAGCVILAHNIRRLGEEDGISAYFWGSEIRSVAYLNRVRSARVFYRRLLRG